MQGSSLLCVSPTQPPPPRFLDSNKRLRSHSNNFPPASPAESFVYVANVQGIFSVVQVHDVNEAVLDVTLRTVDPHTEDILRRRMNIPKDYPLRVWYNKRTKTCVPNRLGRLYEAAQQYLDV
jgi:hypothetical protein